MDDHLPTSLSILNKEWAELGRSAVPDGWHPEGPASPPGTLAELLAAVTEDPDGWLRVLIARQQAGDQLAGRVVLQSMLGVLVIMAARDRRHDVGEYIAECWLQICRYPLVRRPVRISANLALDTRKAVRAGDVHDELPVPPGDPDLLPATPTMTAGSVVRAATRLGLIDPAAGASLYAVYGLGLRSHEAAVHLRISPALVRWRNSRSIRRLAREAAILAEVA